MPRPRGTGRQVGVGGGQLMSQEFYLARPPAAFLACLTFALPDLKIMRKKKLTGFTLVEVIVSLLILLSTAAGIFASFVAAQNYVVRSKRRIAAVNFARQKFEKLRPYVRQDTWAVSSTNLLWAAEGATQAYGPEIFSFTDIWTGQLNYTVTNTVNTALRPVSVTANWTEPD